MGNMRTLAFQASKELFQKIKDYLQRNNMTQKQFVIGLIEIDIERDLTQRAAVSEAPTDSEGVEEEHAEQHETAAVSDCERAFEETGETTQRNRKAPIFRTILTAIAVKPRTWMTRWTSPRIKGCRWECK